MATKQDIEELKDELQKLEYRLVIKLGAVVAAILTVGLGAFATLSKLL